MSLVNDLKFRGLIYGMTDPDLEKALDNEKLVFYMGVDPTADSLHIGHLLACLVAKRLENYGHMPILVIGGGTGLIGDPSFKSQERQLLSIETSLKNAEGISRQVRKLLPDAKVVNNYDWLSSLNAIEFLRDIGKHFNVAYMVAKDSVKSRIETGLSFTEFSYQIIQAWDFEHLYANHGCTLQIGGQDQWGNITAGMELIRKLHGSDAKAYGFTFPLVTKADGTKFGKSDGGNLWLDPEKSSPYEFYQFWINTADDDVILRLKQFTFLDEKEIEDISRKFIEAPHERLAQKILAKELTDLVHGEAACLEAIKISEALFSGEIHTLTKAEIAMGFANLIDKCIASDSSLVDLMIDLKLASSKREARELIQGGAVSVNGNKISDLNFTVSKRQAIEETYTVIKKGKKAFAIVEHQ
ncbi:MAG: tyrosine--tRNA ligase [Candidatus Izemoplasmatales bacterium]|nr:tyrosine--tRNA ligase [Candidatus Izemoplasmatales bacterium]